jgi:hypothetical protein
MNEDRIIGLLAGLGMFLFVVAMVVLLEWAW